MHLWKLYDGIEQALALLALVGTVVAVLTAGIGRSVGAPVTSAPQFAQLFLIWTCMLGADLAMKRGEAIRVSGIPSFAPELLQTVRAGDPMKAKHLEKALMQFAEEGAAKVFKPAIGSGFIVGVVGALQFEVLASRIELEYGLPVRFEPSQFTSARWVNGMKQAVDKFTESNKQHIAHDHDGDIVYLTRLQWDIDRVERDYPDVKLTATKEMMV